MNSLTTGLLGSDQSAGYIDGVEQLATGAKQLSGLTGIGQVYAGIVNLNNAVSGVNTEGTLQNGTAALKAGIKQIQDQVSALQNTTRPRVANRFLKRIRDFATVLGDGIIDRDVALLGLKRMDVDALGLDELDRSLLRAIIEMYNGGPVGLETLAAALGEEAVTLEDLCEPYLMQMGFLTRTPRRQAWRSPAWCTPLIWRRIGSS